MKEDNADLIAILAVLRGHGDLWHRTSVENLRGIVDFGAIQPTNARFGLRYASYGSYLGAVCLFDFDSESLEEILNQSGHWAQFLQDCGPATVFLRINKAALAAKNLILPPEIRKANVPTLETEDGQTYIPRLIPRVEGWFKGHIPIQAVTEALIIKRYSGYEYVRMSVDANSLSAIQNFNKVWLEEAGRQPIQGIAKRLEAARAKRLGL